MPKFKRVCIGIRHMIYYIHIVYILQRLYLRNIIYRYIYTAIYIILYYIDTQAASCAASLADVRRRPPGVFLVHARGIYIYLCVYTLCSRLIYIVVISEAIFFFCLVRLVQTFRSRNNHNNNNNNTNGPSGRNFIIIIYIDGPRAVDHYCTWRNRLCTRGRTVSFFLAFLPFIAPALYTYIYRYGYLHHTAVLRSGDEKCVLRVCPHCLVCSAHYIHISRRTTGDRWRISTCICTAYIYI